MDEEAVIKAMETLRPVTSADESAAVADPSQAFCGLSCWGHLPSLPESHGRDGAAKHSHGGGNRMGGTSMG